MEIIENSLREAIEVKSALLNDEKKLNLIKSAAEFCIESLARGGKVLLCGNGGSAADAQHIAAELSGRFKYDRPPLYAEALHVNGSYMTAVANDYSYDVVFSRLVEAMGNGGDVLIALSTSGNSKNVIEAVKAANGKKMTTIGLTGKEGGKLKELCDICILVPSADTARIQECHITIGHIICEKIEKTMFPK
jgi:D-sedoheptulose 7-phosphate isomerase